MHQQERVGESGILPAMSIAVTTVLPLPVAVLTVIRGNRFVLGAGLEA